MANDTQITVTGNVTGDPELHFTPSGAAVVNFTVASTPRQFDKNTNEWKDGETLFMRCNAWRDQAENIAQSITRGDRVIVTGTLGQRNWEDKNGGGKRSAVELTVMEVGPSLLYGITKSQKVDRRNGGGASAGNSGSGFGQGGGQAAQSSQAGSSDPWGKGPSSGGFGSSATDEPPF